MRSLILLFFITFAIPASSAVVREPNSGIWLGNICQTPRGWEVVPWQPVGTVCWSPGWRSYGFIANY